MPAARVVEPEWLDTLPPDNPRAQRSRRDLVRVNGLMGNARIVRKELARLPCVRSLAELGAGSGEFCLGVLSPARPVHATLLDLHPVVSSATLEAFSRLGHRADCVTADVFEWLSSPGTPVQDVVVANLFLHHFEPARLAEMLAGVSRKARAFIACEPRRSRFALAGAKALGLVGCNDVTRHDAVVSVRAGFGDGEISALWPAGEDWSLREGARGLFSHVFVAVRACT
jgi:hypothetical protein